MARARLDKASSRRFHEIFCDEWHQQRLGLEASARISPAARLALDMGLTDSIVRHNHSGEDLLVAQAFDDLVSDVTPAALRRTLEQCGPDADRECDPEAIEGMIGRGINPIALLRLERAMAVDAESASGEHAVYDADGHMNYMCILPDGGGRRGIEYDYAVFQLADSTWWDGSSLMLPLGSIPETLQALMPRQPIGRVISHPLIRTDLPIVTVKNDSTTIEVVPLRLFDTLTWREAIGRHL